MATTPKKGLSLRQLISKTPAFFRNSAEDVVIKKLERKHTKSGLNAVVANAYGVESKQTRPHKQTIVGMNRDLKTGKPLPVSKCKRVIVQCSCQDYVFRQEYANWKNDCARIVYSNGEPATFTNPGNAPGLCKHLVKVGKKVIEKGW